MVVLNNIRRLDLFRKVPTDLTQTTLTGAIFSVCCVIFMSALFVSELWHYLTPELVNELFVEQPPEGGVNNKIDVRLNVSLPRLECQYAGLDIQDDSGRHEVGALANMIKTELQSRDSRGLKHVGCRLEVSFQINKVPGNFHLSTHSASHQPNTIDMAHIIHEISFGDDVRRLKLHGSFDPLAHTKILDDSPLQSHEYHLRIVPSIYEDINGNQLRPYQYTFAHKKFISLGITGHVIPAVWFKYDINPISVKYIERRRPLYEFLCMTCAIIGGTFTVMSLIDSMVYTASNVLEKLEIGKLMWCHMLWFETRNKQTNSWRYYKAKRIQSNHSAFRCNINCSTERN